MSGDVPAGGLAGAAQPAPGDGAELVVGVEPAASIASIASTTGTALGAGSEMKSLSASAAGFVGGSTSGDGAELVVGVEPAADTESGDTAEPVVGGVGGVGGVVAGSDGRLRCPWALSAPEYVSYHDTEWGRPVRDTVGLFERITLEAFQSGLSWLTILRKREAFRRAFAGFDPEAVARFGPPDVERLLADAGIVRNRRKIEATVTNARAVLGLTTPLGDLVWSFRPEPAPPVEKVADVPAVTAESVALAKALKKAGFVFLGPTTAYALMQACGLVDDHLAGCHARGGDPPPTGVDRRHHQPGTYPVAR